MTPGYPGVTPGSKTLILSISGPWDLLETIPRAISDRMVQVPSDLVSSRVSLGQNKVPRALSTVFGVGGVIHLGFYHFFIGFYLQNIPGTQMTNHPPGGEAFHEGPR